MIFNIFPKRIIEKSDSLINLAGSDETNRVR